MSRYAKLFEHIVRSTIWGEQLHTKVVWITLLAIKDKHGEVLGSIPGLAQMAGVTTPQCEEALERLKAPDKYSRTKEFEGRRIEEIDGGWFILNSEKYSKMKSKEDELEKTARRVQRFRDRQKLKGEPVTPVTPSNTQKHQETQNPTDVDVDVDVSLPNTTMPSAPLVIRKRRPANGSSLDVIKHAGDREVFQTLWEEWPREREGKPARGEKPKAQTCFQSILDGGEVSAEELLQAARVYISEDARVRAGYPKMVSSWLALKDGFWKQCVQTVRARSVEAM